MPPSWSSATPSRTRGRLERRWILEVARVNGANALLIPDGLTFSADDFADTTHLEPAAARRYTVWLADHLDLGPWRAR